MLISSLNMDMNQNLGIYCLRKSNTTQGDQEKHLKTATAVPLAVGPFSLAINNKQTLLYINTLQAGHWNQKPIFMQRLSILQFSCPSRSKLRSTRFSSDGQSKTNNQRKHRK